MKAKMVIRLPLQFSQNQIPKHGKSLNHPMDSTGYWNLL